MKKYLILFFILSCLTLQSFGQERKDSAENRHNKNFYTIGLSVYSSQQFDFALGLIHNRHIIECGIIMGPTYSFKLHDAGFYKPYDYLIPYKLDFRKFSIHGVDISYQYIFSSKECATHRIVSFFEFSNYSSVPTPDPYNNIYIKKQIHILLGYNFSFNISRKIILGFSFLPGIKYYWDEQKFNDPYPSNPPGPTEYNWEKLLPSFVIKFDIKYKL